MYFALHAADQGAVKYREVQQVAKFSEFEREHHEPGARRALKESTQPIVSLFEDVSVERSRHQLLLYPTG